MWQRKQLSVSKQTLGIEIERTTLVDLALKDFQISREIESRMKKNTWYGVTEVDGWMAYCLLKLGMPDRALILIDLAIKRKDYMQGKHLYIKGVILKSRKKYEEASECF